MLPIMIQTMHPGKFNMNEISHPLSAESTLSKPAVENASAISSAEDENTSTASSSMFEGAEGSLDGQSTEPSLIDANEQAAGRPTHDDGAQASPPTVMRLSNNIKQSQHQSEPVIGAEQKSEKSESSANQSEAEARDCVPAAGAPAMPFHDQLIRQTHTKMANKFAQLEAETGIQLRSTAEPGEDRTDSNPKQTANVNADGLPSDGSNSGSVITSNNNTTIDPHKQIDRRQNIDTQRAQSNTTDELHSLKEDLRLKNEIVDKLSYIRSQVEAELQDLTASLFEEANKMVQSANVLRQKAEQDSKDTSMQMEILSAENVALKNLVIHSTPSTPKKNVSFLHAAQKKRSTSKPRSAKGMPNKSPSNYELGASEANNNTSHSESQHKSSIPNEENNNDCEQYGDIDPVYYQEFKDWHKSPILDPSRSAFMKRIYDEEIYTVFNFRNKNLTSAIIRAIECNTLTVERIKGDPKDKFPRKCKLLEDSRPCVYRMRVDEGPWHFICSLSRERITTVCDLLCYLRYVKDGLVKSEPKEIYWQIMRRRHSITKARLGFLTA